MPQKKKRLSLKEQLERMGEINRDLQYRNGHLQKLLAEKDLEIEKLRKPRGSIYISPDALIPRMGLADNVANALHLQKSLTDLAERIQRGEE